MSGETQVPILGQDFNYPQWVLRTGFFNLPPCKCDTKYFIEQSDVSDMQVLHVSLNKYQEILSLSHDNMGYRDPAISISRAAGQTGMRFKNMSGNNGKKMMITPGYNARVVPFDLSEYPEMVVKPENFLAAFDGNLRRDWELREGTPDGKFKLPLYNSIAGAGAIFLRTGGHSTWRNLEAGASILCSIPNLVAFQSFCELDVQTIDSPIKSKLSSKPVAIFPHLLVSGPGIVMLSCLHHEEHIYPLNLDQFPRLIIKPDVFLASSDINLTITAEQMNRQGSKVPCGRIMMHLNGTGMVMLKLAGIVKFLMLPPTETIFLSTSSLVGYQNSCKVVEEALPAPPAKEFDDIRITGPGLIILQSASMEGLPPDHPTDHALPPPTRAKMKELMEKNKVNKERRSIRASTTPMRAQVAPEIVAKAAAEAQERQALADGVAW